MEREPRIVFLMIGTNDLRLGTPFSETSRTSGLDQMAAGEMRHKLKIGTVVNYRPRDRMLSTARGTYTVTGVMQASDGQPEYRIKHFSEDFERMAFENELSADEP
jgi:hypothetical protein